MEHKNYKQEASVDARIILEHCQDTSVVCDTCRKHEPVAHALYLELLLLTSRSEFNIRYMRKMTDFEIIERDSLSWPTWTRQRVMHLIDWGYLLYGLRWLSGKPDVVGSPELVIPQRELNGFKVTARKVADFNVYDVSLETPPAEQASSAKPKRLIFFSGGAFREEASPFHWSYLTHYIKRVPGLNATMVSYPLAPKNNAPSAYASIQKASQALLAEAAAKGEHAIFAGDSAGGNLVLSLPLNAGPDALLPSTIIAISPAVDVSHDNPDIKKIDPFDPMLSEKFIEKASFDWRGDWSVKDPRLSPLFADLTPLIERKVQLYGVIGRYDVLAPDAVLFMEKCKKAGVSGKWLVWDKLEHCFPLSVYFNAAEGVEATNWLIDLVKQA